MVKASAHVTRSAFGNTQAEPFTEPGNVGGIVGKRSDHVCGAVADDQGVPASYAGGKERFVRLETKLEFHALVVETPGVATLVEHNTGAVIACGFYAAYVEVVTDAPALDFEAFAELARLETFLFQGLDIFRQCCRFRGGRFYRPLSACAH